MNVYKSKKVFSVLLTAVLSLAVCSSETAANEFYGKLSDIKAKMTAQYGENRRINDNNYDKSLAVKCVNGTFVGKNTDGVIAYKGIPFVGKQPVGELRWKAPVDYTPDEGVYEAYYNAKSPRQDETSSEPASLYVQGEDCLYLNIWKADNNNSNSPSFGAVRLNGEDLNNVNAKRPVMVWVHGGAFEVGGTADPMYECHNLVSENPDIIAVSIAYRVGIFGFLHLSHLPDGKDYPDAQNLGLMDQMMALKWVHENIAAFGGDPENVTIFGESAGAGSVTLLPLIQGSHKYFKRVIAQSGSPTLCRSVEQAVAATNEIMEALGCETVAELNGVDAQKLVDTATEILEMRTSPERDGNYLPLDPYGAYADGAARDIAILHGCNKDEMNYFVMEYGGVEPFIEWADGCMKKKFAEMTDAERVLAEGFFNDAKKDAKEGESYVPYSKWLSQIWFNAPLIRLSENQTKAGGKSYTYYFTPESAIPMMKCGHALELASVFNHPENTIYTGRAFDETFSRTMRKMWVQFAKTGNPSLSAEMSPDAEAHKWPLYNLEDREIMVFDEFNIHPEKEHDLKIIDWERTYFLTKYYCI